jgi:NOL1/NOP2/fmu family ribosome biogenesis protein
VYSTCTLTPEENEGVISFILNKFSEQVFSFDLGLDKIHDFKLQQAIDDAKRVQDLQKYLRSFQAFRLWPQTYDTEGFFCAILEKRAPTRPVDRMDFVERFEQRLSKSATQSIARSLTQWYGVPFLHDDEALASSKKQIFMTTKEALQFPLPTSDFAMGLPFGKPTDHGLPRLSHEMATLRGMEATTQIIDVNSDAFLALLRGENLKGVSRKSIADGDVLLHYNALEDFTVCVGRGLLKNNDIWNRLPREIVRMHG